MIAAADIRAIRARLKETQEKFGERFGTTRFHVMNWEKYGIADAPAIEQVLAEINSAEKIGTSD
jgi:DNA-binding transcriptional regulator YiaG